jgi:hypothetical protein
MAKGLNEFTVQEATNFDAFSDWNYEVLTLDGAGGDTSQYITSINPAKKVVLYHVPTADASTTLDDDDLMSITINGKTDGNKVIKIDPGDLPFTISGLAITSLKVVSAGNAASDSIACLSFH